MAHGGQAVRQRQTIKPRGGFLVSTSVELSPKHGVNPTLSVCFWCGKERGDIALLGRIRGRDGKEDIEAPHRAVVDYEPCDKCKHNFSLGLTVIEATSEPNEVTSLEIQSGVYPTGRYVVIKPEAAARIFKNIESKATKVFVDRKVFEQMFDCR